MFLGMGHGFLCDGGKPRLDRGVPNDLNWPNVVVVATNFYMMYCNTISELEANYRRVINCNP